MAIEILEDEQKISSIKICENCGHKKMGREIESFGWMGEKRGYFFLCFDCFKPRIKWRSGEHGRSYWTPKCQN